MTADEALWAATAGGARALRRSDVGVVRPGARADLVVLDLHSTPLIAYRMDQAQDLEERLFVQMTLGDDRAVRETDRPGRGPGAGCSPTRSTRHRRRG